MRKPTLTDMKEMLETWRKLRATYSEIREIKLNEVPTYSLYPELTEDLLRLELTILFADLEIFFPIKQSETLALLAIEMIRTNCTFAEFLKSLLQKGGSK